MTKHVAIYARLSPRGDGNYEGVGDQEKWGRAYASQHWPGVPVEVFSDKGFSAANGDTRPGFDRLRRWITHGKIAHVWVVEQSRLTRNEIEWFTLVPDLVAAGITEVHTNRDGVVRVADALAGIKTVLNADEVRKLKKRLNDRLAEIAKSGRPAGAAVFGYRHGVNEAGEKSLIIVPEEADAIRWAADKVLGGWSLARVAADLRTRGLRGALGGQLRPSRVRDMLTNAAVSGQRVHRGEIIGAGNWDAILDAATWQACRDRLAQPRVVQRADGTDYVVPGGHQSPGRKYLLTGGLARCAICKAPLIGSVRRTRSGGTRNYLLCHANKGGRMCTGVVLEDTERHVLDELWRELDKPEFLAAISSGDDHAARRDEIAKALVGIDAQRKRNARRNGLGEIDDDEWQALRTGLAEREHELRTELIELPPPPIDVDIEQARTAWSAMVLDEQREFIRLFIKTVWLRKATPGARQFDPARVDIEWLRVSAVAAAG